MSDPLATSILSKLTNWYKFDSNLNDAHGSDHLTLGLSGVTYGAGINGNQVASGSRAYATLAAPVPFAVTGAMTIGGWFQYTSGAEARPEFGYSYGGVSSGDEAFKIVVNPAGFFYVITWHDAGISNTAVVDPLQSARNYPITVSAKDSAGQTATSPQIIRIASSGGLVPGRYFVVATRSANGTMRLYIDSVLAASGGPCSAVKLTPLPRIEIGRNYSAATSVTAMDDCFACSGAELTAAEVGYIYNGGASRTYSAIVAAS